jgi:hypothetical protein
LQVRHVLSRIFAALQCRNSAAYLPLGVTVMGVPNSLDPIVARFLSLEATPHVRALLLSAMAEANESSSIEKRNFEFNVFDVEVNFAASTVTIADVLSANVESTLPLADFRAAIAAETTAQP